MKAKKKGWLVWALILFLLGGSFSAWAGSFHCQTGVEAFDPNQPSKKIGDFTAGSDLELGEPRKSDGMVPVTYHSPDGQTIVALCNARDVGLGPKTASSDPGAQTNATSPLPPKSKVTDLAEGLRLAAQYKKMLFVKFGRAACGNCQAIGKMMESGQIQLPPSDFIVAEINCDDEKQNQLFNRHFHVKGETLPFIVIASPSGQQLAAHTGYAEAPEFMKMIDETKKKQL